MSLNLNIVIAFPSKGDAESVKVWKDAVLWAQEHVKHGLVSTPGAPTLPSVASALRVSNGDGKGQWERAWIEKSGKKSVRFTSRVQSLLNPDGSPLYPDKESYCRALCEGTAKDDSGEDDKLDAETPTPTVLPLDEIDQDDI